MIAAVASLPIAPILGERCAKSNRLVQVFGIANKTKSQALIVRLSKKCHVAWFAAMKWKYHFRASKRE
jgi:hypothetical protein